MSVTFYIEGHIENEDLCLNVANGTACIILDEILDIKPTADLCGTLDPKDVLSRLATAQADEHVRPTDDNLGIETTLSENGVSVKKVCRVISLGYDEKRIQRYIDELTKIATHAVTLGSKIVYA